MHRLPTLALALLAAGCAAKPSEPESNRAKPGETVEARLAVAGPWRHGGDGAFAVTYEVDRPGKGRVRLEASDLPADFLPVVEVAFEQDDKPLGAPIELQFDPDC